MTICKHFGQCGGCAFQGLSAEEEQSRKEDLFHDAFRGISYDIMDFKQVPLHSRRRASLSARKTKKTVQIGFNEKASHNIVTIEECLVVSPQILALKSFIHAITPRLASRSAVLKFHMTQAENGFDIVVENTKPIDPIAKAEIAALCPQHKIRRLQFDSEVIYRDDDVMIKIGEFDIAIPPRPFLQACRESEDMLRKIAHDAVAGHRHIADLFSGLGTFSFGLKSNVTAFEGSQELTNFMTSNINRLQLHHIVAHCRDLFRDPLTAKELKEFDAVIIDPPRAGAKAQCEELAKSGVQTIAYVSCNPKSFARDAEILIAGGYKMGAVHLIDQFRFSDHLESVAIFKS